MDDAFEIPVVYKGEQLNFPARLVQTGYSYRFEVNVHDHEIWFEPDDEGRYRALVNAEQFSKTHIEVELLRSIAEAIESLV